MLCISVGDEVQSDDAEDAEGGGCRTGDEQGSGVSANDREEPPCSVAQIRIVAPGAQQRGRSDDEDSEGEGDEEEPQAEVRSRGVPIHDELSGVRRFELRGLDAAGEERGHEQNCGEDEQQFESGEGAANRVHGFTLYCKVTSKSKHKCDVYHSAHSYISFVIAYGRSYATCPQ